MAGVLWRLRRGGRRAREIVGSSWTGGAACGTCGFAGRPLHRDVLWPGLIDEWALDAEWARWMNAREGSRCAWCGSSLRSGQLARAIVMVANRRAGSRASHLSQLFRDGQARRLAIAEVNSAGNLHRYLARCRGLRHSEYGSHTPGVASEDLMALSYADAAFDMVITSDTLEHLPDVDRALRETCRVLRPGGAHVFSVPVVWDRPTRQRVRVDHGKLVHLLPPSYHGAAADAKADFLVFNEFGADFTARCGAAGFEVELVRDAHNPALVTFIARKPASAPAPAP